MNREQWLEKATSKFRPEFEKAGFPLPEKIRSIEQGSSPPEHGNWRTLEPQSFM